MFGVKIPIGYVLKDKILCTNHVLSHLNLQPFDSKWKNKYYVSNSFSPGTIITAKDECDLKYHKRNYKMHKGQSLVLTKEVKLTVRGQIQIYKFPTKANINRFVSKKYINQTFNKGSEIIANKNTKLYIQGFNNVKLNKGEKYILPETSRVYSTNVSIRKDDIVRFLELSSSE